MARRLGNVALWAGFAATAFLIYGASTAPAGLHADDIFWASCCILVPAYAVRYILGD
jgi:hypothetical protein